MDVLKLLETHSVFSRLPIINCRLPINLKKVIRDGIIDSIYDNFMPISASLAEGESHLKNLKELLLSVFNSILEENVFAPSSQGDPLIQQKIKEMIILLLPHPIICSTEKEKMELIIKALNARLLSVEHDQDSSIIKNHLKFLIPIMLDPQNNKMNDLVVLLNNNIPPIIGDEIFSYLYDHFAPMMRDIQAPLPTCRNQQEFRDREKLKETRSENIKKCDHLKTCLMKFAPQLKDGVHRQKMGELIYPLVSDPVFSFSSEERMKLLSIAYQHTTLPVEQQSFVLQEMKNFFADPTLPLYVLEQNYHQYISHWQHHGLPYGKEFSKILAEMLGFQTSISGGQAFTQNMHDRPSLVYLNKLLERLLSEEREERKHLTIAQNEEMLSDLVRIFNSLPPSVQETVQGYSVGHSQDYLQLALIRIDIMRSALKADPTLSGSQWYRIDEKEIWTPDHTEEGQATKYVNQGRSLQLLYDTLKKHESEPKKYEDLLLSLVISLGSKEAMGGCTTGAIEKFIRPSQITYADYEALKKEQFNPEEDKERFLRELAKVKSFIIAMLDQWRLNPHIFAEPIQKDSYPMIDQEFLENLTQKNTNMSVFFNTLNSFNWQIILQDLGSQSLHEVFSKVDHSDKEIEIIKDLHTLLIIPALRAFVHFEYKDFLKNGSLDPNPDIKDAVSFKLLPGQYPVSQDMLDEHLRQLKDTSHLSVLPNQYYLWENNHWEPKILSYPISLHGMINEDIFVNDPTLKLVLNDGAYIIEFSKTTAHLPLLENSFYYWNGVRWVADDFILYPSAKLIFNDQQEGTKFANDPNLECVFEDGKYTITSLLQPNRDTTELPFLENSFYAWSGFSWVADDLILYPSAKLIFNDQQEGTKFANDPNLECVFEDGKYTITSLLQPNRDTTELPFLENSFYAWSGFSWVAPTIVIDLVGIIHHLSQQEDVFVNDPNLEHIFDGEKHIIRRKPASENP